MRVEHEQRTGAAGEQAWEAVAGGAWAGPIRLHDGEDEYAGLLRLVDVDEDARRAGAHAQVRKLGGWGGAAVALSVRPAGGGGTLVLAGDAVLTGAAGQTVADRLVAEAGDRIAVAVRALDRSPADDPAWRRRLAARAALAIALGAAAGLAGARWGRGRRA